MKTPWSESLDASKVLPEYPRPQLKRDSYMNLNGLWEFAMCPPEEKPEGPYPEKILVPFSPEAPLSGVNRIKKPEDVLYYRRSFTLPQGFHKEKVLLHFGAVDCAAEVSLNGRQVGSHRGGYWPFAVDITEAIAENNVLTVLVTDESTETLIDARGKQSREPGGIWYTAQSGIWQTVWLESVPAEYIEGLSVTPLFDEGAVTLTVHTSAPLKCLVVVEGMTYSAASDKPIHIPMPSFRPWSPEDPYLYSFTVTAGKDQVKSYFAMRKFSVGVDEKGAPRLCLNNRPYFMNGVLDQGYWPDGLYTPCAEEAMVCDIQTMKALGYNTLRKHAKIEPLRWYHLCDVMGMLVWQDMVSGGGPYRVSVVDLPVAGFLNRIDNSYKAFGRDSEESRERFEQELEETVKCLYNCPCIALWTVFNEGWGQFDALAMTDKLRALDKTRLIDHASGWHDQGGGDVCSKHVYFRKYRFKKDPLHRPVALTEFGGYALGLEEHRFSEKDYGYKRFSSEEALLGGIMKLYEKEILPAAEKGLSAAVYTQLSDVEEELNGLLTYDRKVLKVKPEQLQEINGKLTEGNYGAAQK